MNNYIQSILSFFATMDIDSLRRYLKDEYSYQEVSKDVLLDKLAELFLTYKNGGDTELIVYPGQCAGEACPNCGLKGFRFVGNNSANYMDLVFEIAGDDIKDICNCAQFRPNAKNVDTGTINTLIFNEDDRIAFNRTPEYWSKVYSASAAYNEIISNRPKRIDFDELSYWVDKHSVTDELIGSYDIFRPKMSWTRFSILYEDLKRARNYISRYMPDIGQASSEICLIKTETELIDWVLINETLYETAPYVLQNDFFKNGDVYIFESYSTLQFYGDQFGQTVNFLNFYHTNHQNLMEKYTTYTYEEENELRTKVGYNEESDDLFTLKFHLDNRKAAVELGVSFPFFINQETMPF